MAARAGTDSMTRDIENFEKRLDLIRRVYPYAAIDPPAPDPTTITSYAGFVLLLVMRGMGD